MSVYSVSTSGDRDTLGVPPDYPPAGGIGGAIMATTTNKNSKNTRNDKATPQSTVNLAHTQIRAHAILDTDTMNAYDGQLGYYTTRIEAARAVGVSAALSICADLHSVSNLKEELKANGFKGVGDYAESTFGYKKSNAAAMAAVGKRFLDASGNIKNEMLKGLTWSKLDLLKSLTDGQIEELVESGVTLDSSARDIRAGVKALKAPQNDSKTTETPSKGKTTKNDEKSASAAPTASETASNNSDSERSDDSYTIAERNRLIARIAELEMLLEARNERIAELETLVRSRDKYIASLQAQYNNHDNNPNNEPARI